MGQYHMVVNLDKKEYLNAHDFNQGIKLLEFGCSSMGLAYAMSVMLIDDAKLNLSKTFKKTKTGSKFIDEGDHTPLNMFKGRWAGDRIVVAGDYAEKGDPCETAKTTHYEKCSNGTYTNVSVPLSIAINSNPICAGMAASDALSNTDNDYFHRDWHKAKQLYSSWSDLFQQEHSEKEKIKNIQWNVNTFNVDSQDVAILNVDTGEYVKASTFGNVDHLAYAGMHWGLMTAIVCMLSNSNGRGGGDLRDSGIGAWCGARLALVSDISNSGDAKEDVSQYAYNTISLDDWVAQDLKERFAETA